MKAGFLGLLISIALIYPEGATLSTSTVKTTTVRTTTVKTTTKKDLKSGHENDTLDQKRILKLFNLMQVSTKQPLNYYAENPLFVSFPGVIQLEDDVAVSTEIGRVRAIDVTDKQRRCFYYLHLASEDFSVDIDTGAIRTKSRLDTGPHSDLTSYALTIYALFRNETEKFVYKEDHKEILALTNLYVECVDIRVNVVHGALRGRTNNQATAVTAECSSCNGVYYWIEDPIVALVINVFSVILIIILVVVIIHIICLKWKHRRLNDSPPPPICVQIAPEPCKI